jgi:phosphoribosylglycinamide formyltransferase-1
MARLKLGVLGSGRGSNFRAIQDQIERGGLPAEVLIVISDVEVAGILEIARRHGIKATYVAPGRFLTKLEPESEKKIVALLKAEKIDFVVLAGFMRMLKTPMLNAFPGRIINIHPSLLPRFPGLEAWRQALEAGETATGCTVHFVDAGMDSGPIILQREVPIMPDDTPASLHARIQQVEHMLYPEAIRKLSGDLR